MELAREQCCLAQRADAIGSTLGALSSKRESILAATTVESVARALDQDPRASSRGPPSA